MLSSKKAEVGGVRFYNEAEAVEALGAVWSLLISSGLKKTSTEKIGAAKFCLAGAEQGLFSPRKSGTVIKVCKDIIAKNKQ